MIGSACVESTSSGHHAHLLRGAAHQTNVYSGRCPVGPFWMSLQYASGLHCIRPIQLSMAPQFGEQYGQSGFIARK